MGYTMPLTIVSSMHSDHEDPWIRSWESYSIQRSIISSTVYTTDNTQRRMVSSMVYAIERPMGHTIIHGLHHGTHDGVFHARRP